MSFYHAGQRSLQQQFGSVPLADRLQQVTRRESLTDEDRVFIEGASFFFLATADEQGRPDCSFKGGAPGFVRVITRDLIVFPDYDGNGMFRSLGNLTINPAVGMLFIRMSDSPKRLRVNGRAEVSFDDPLLQSMPEAQALVRVKPEHIFPNCPRYVHDAAQGALSPYTPVDGRTPQEPTWKSFDSFKDVVPPRRRA